MEEIKNFQQFNEDEETGFDLQEWIARFIHFWWLFAICIAVALAASYFKNRTWIESYLSTGTVIIEESKYGANSQNLMQGFGIESGYRNVDNQIVMLTSYDLVNRVVDSLPFMKVDYISKGQFKTRNLYKNSPVYITADYVAPQIQGVLFKIKVKSDGSYLISDENGSVDKNMKMTGRIGQPIQNNLFFITANWANSQAQDVELFFRFRSKESLVSDFSGRLNLKYILDGSSVLGISLTSEVPERDIDFINKLAETFLAENLERKNDVANKTVKFIDEQLENVAKSLSVSEGAMTDFRQSNQIVDLPSHSSEILGKATEYDAKKSEMKLRDSYFNYLSSYLKQICHRVL